MTTSHRLCVVAGAFFGYGTHGGMIGWVCFFAGCAAFAGAWALAEGGE